MDDDLDRLLVQRGERWRDAQPPPPAPDVSALTGRRSPPRWVVPLVAAASVVALAAGGAVLVGRDDDRRPEPVDTVTPDPDAVVPFLPLDPRAPAYAAPTRVLVPDPVVDPAIPDCEASELRATSAQRDMGSGISFVDFTVTISRPGSETCALRGQPEVTLLDRGRPIPVRVDHPEPSAEFWSGDVVVGDGQRALVRLHWIASACPLLAPHDRVALTWPGAGQLTAPGFDEVPVICTGSEARGTPTISFGGLTPEQWRWEDRHPLSPDGFTVRQYDAELGEAGERVTFFVMLGGNGREVDLSPCPDYEFEATYSFDDVANERFGLNCDAIPFRRADGTPYLPKDQGVRFAFESVLAGSNVEKLTWRLLTPQPLELLLDVPSRTPVS